MQQRIEISSDIIANKKHVFLLGEHDFNFVFLWGGRGGAKTSDLVKIITLEALKEKYLRCVVILKDANKLNEGIHQQFKDFIISAGLQRYFKITDSPARIKCHNGNVIIFRNGKDAKTVKGLANFNYALFEEVDQIKKDDYDFIVGTVRSINGSKYRIYHTFNPESDKQSYKDHWIFKTHFENLKDIYRSFQRIVRLKIGAEEKAVKTVYVHSTADDNPKCPYENIMFYDSFKYTNKAKYNIWRLGRWSNKDTENLYAYNFDFDTHVKELDFIEDLPVHLSFDQNRKPYSTCTVWQILEQDNITIRQIDEICLKPPKNATEHIVDKILEEYPGCRFIIYGDHSGKNKTQQIQESAYRNHYDYIRRNLGEYNGNKFVSHILAERIKPNPPRRPRREIMNTIFSGRTKFRIEIDPRCKNSIADWELGEIDNNGFYHKAKDTQGKELYGHCYDTTIYLLYGLYKEELFRSKAHIR